MLSAVAKVLLIASQNDKCSCWAKNGNARVIVVIVHRKARMVKRLPCALKLAFERFETSGFAHFAPRR